MKRVDDAVLRDAARLVTDAEAYDEMAARSYLHAAPLVSRLFWKRLDTAAQLLNANGARYESGLDFGCGLGVLLPTLSEMTTRVYATDRTMTAARRVAATLHIENVTFIEPGELVDRIQPGSLDYVVSTDVLEHVTDLGMVVGMLGGLLKRGGRFVISGPTENTVYKLGRLLAGFGRNPRYHLKDIHQIHEHIEHCGLFKETARRVLPVPGLVEAFYVYSYIRIAGDHGAE